MKFGYAAVGLVLAAWLGGAHAQPGANEIVQQCDLGTYPGEDQHTTLTVVLRDAAGNEQRNVYDRYWIDNEGRDQIVDKMLLITEFPPDASGTAFMRWGYMPEAGKNAEQWLYLPSLNTLRRVSVRDPGDSFLGSDLTYQDISWRGVEADEHRLLREEQVDGVPHWVVESVAKERNPLYGKRIVWYAQAANPGDCLKTRIEYYDTRDSLIKTQTLKWQKVGDAWLWDEVFVENVRTGTSSLFKVTDAKVNVGLQDRMFSERTMRRGVR